VEARVLPNFDRIADVAVARTTIHSTRSVKRRRTRSVVGRNTTSRSSGSDFTDTVRLAFLASRVRRTGVERVLASIAGPDPDPRTAATGAAVAQQCAFDHEAILVFPERVGDTARFLRERGFEVADAVPSVVVRSRLTSRYGLASSALDVSILRASTTLGSGERRGIEAFCVPRASAPEIMIECERRENNEAHVALMVTDPTDIRLWALRATLLADFSLRADGGGYNPRDGAATGGRSVLYFRAPSGARLELTCAGNFAQIVDAHCGDAR